MNSPSFIAGRDDSTLRLNPDCPPFTQLWMLLHDRLSADDEERLTEHVEHCRRCQQSLDDISDRNDHTLRAMPEIPGYQIEIELGRGGFGAVYLARCAQDDSLVALKILSRELAQTTAGRKRFELEVAALQRLDHPGIARVLDLGEADGRPYFAMTYVDGVTLSAVVQGRPQPERGATQLIAELAEIVQFAHEQGIVHRDLKPDNILLERTAAGPPSLANCSGERIHPRIIDFGLAKLLDDGSGLTHTGALLGTLDYMAPEQLGGVEEITPAADIYALGAVLYLLLTGRPPHQAATFPEMMHNIQHEDPAAVRTLVPGVSRDIEQVCAKCLQKAPRDRYATAAELQQDLTRCLSGVRPQARPLPWARRVRRWVRRRPTAATLLAAGALGLAGSVGGLAVYAREQQRNAVQLAAERDEVQRNFNTALGAYRLLMTDIERLAEGIPPEPTELQQQTQQIVEFFETLLAKDPGNRDHRQILANAWHYRGRIPHDAVPFGGGGQVGEDVLDAYQHCINHCSVLLADPELSAKFGPLKANTLNNVANIYRDRGSWDRAQLYYEQSIAEWDLLIRALPQNRRYRLYRANAIGNLAGAEWSRWQSIWAKQPAPVEIRRETLAPIVARLRSGLADYRAVFREDPSERDWWSSSACSKDFMFCTDLYLLESDLDGARDTAEQWLNELPDNKYAYLDALPRWARIAQASGRPEDLTSLLRHLEQAQRLKFLLDPEDLAVLELPDFDEFREHTEFQSRIQQIRNQATGETATP